MASKFKARAALASALPLLGALIAACSSGSPSQDDSNSAASSASGPVSVMKWHDPNAIQAAAAPAGAKLVYHGGRVVSNIQVVQVLYGTGSYLPQVTSTAAPSMATFYQQVTNSSYFDWLTEYNTPSTGGTNQKIGHGSFSTQVQITPSSANNGASISDAQIQSELAAQIKAGHLPAPTADAAGNNNTYYAIFFPHGKTINQGGSNSCQAGGFCAYHGTIANVGGHEIYYGVHPDMQAGSGCDTGCGTGTPFSNYQSVASHELVETVTDCEVGIATVIGAPLAWYDQTNGEIGDICNAQQGTIVGGDGQTYTVQKEFSNTAKDCIVAPAGGTDAGTDSGTDAGGNDGGSTCSHSDCTTGTKLVATCDPCVQKICAADSFCCNSSWDSTCVGEVKSICGQTCGGTDAGTDAGTDGGGTDAGTCSHSDCTTGAKLVKTCDPCVTKICTADSFCCNSSWDSICVGEVKSVCGLTCQ